MSGIDTGLASILASRIDSLLESVAGGSRAGAAQTGASTLNVDTPTSTIGAVPLPETPAASAQTVLSEIALTLDAISRFGGEATPAVLGEEPIWPSPPAIDTPAVTENPPSTTQGSASGASAAGAADAEVSGGIASVNSLTTTAAALPVEALAAALEQTVAETGLFYESHLAQWLSGTYSADALADEPQTQLAAQAIQMPLGGNSTASAQGAAGLGLGTGVGELAAWLFGTSGAGSALLAHGGDPQQLAAVLAGELRAGMNTNANANAGGAGQSSMRQSTDSAGGNPLFGATNARAGGAQASAPSSIAASIHPATVPLVRQQLDLLATQQFRWSGQVWPGAKLDWTIEPEPERRRGGEPGDADHLDDEIAWRTRVTLALPTLGTVDANLVLKGSQLIVHVQASPGGAARLSTGGEAFARRLGAAGIELASLSIREIGGSAPAAGGMTQAAGTSAYARAAAEAADAEAHDVSETDSGATAASGHETRAGFAASGMGRRAPSVSPLDHLFDDPFEWTGL